MLHAIRRATGTSVRELTLSTPVDSYERYRAEVAQLFRDGGVRHIRFIDEPVAAALGYGLSLIKERFVLLVDFGGGTLDLAVVQISPSRLEQGLCSIVAKEGYPIGGDHVDQWLVEEFCKRLDFPLELQASDERHRFWYCMLLEEARRAKEMLHYEDEAFFDLVPPEDLRDFQAQLRGSAAPLPLNAALLEDVLRKHRLFDTVAAGLESLEGSVSKRGLDFEAIDDVLLVGGSTMLPGVRAMFEERFGRSRVRYWQPFGAVAYGACAFAAGRLNVSDFLIHDYAIMTHDSQSHEPQYSVIVPRGTRLPTAPDLWKRHLVPTCSLGEPERLFKLVIAELGDAREDASGFLRAPLEHRAQSPATGSEPPQKIVLLNAVDPTLGKLHPPHMPNDRSPRLEVSFGVDEARWLQATVRDLRSNRMLMKGKKIVRLR